MTATISLADLDDKLDEFLCRRVLAKSVGRADLEAADADLVAWFTERGVTLVVDRDTVTHERLPASEDATKFDMIAAFAAERGIPVIDVKVTETSPESVAGLPVEQSGGIASVGCVDSGENRGTTDYTLEVTVGNQRHSVMLSQRYASEDMAARDYLAAASIKRLALVRHTADASQIVRSWEPT